MTDQNTPASLADLTKDTRQIQSPSTLDQQILAKAAQQAKRSRLLRRRRFWIVASAASVAGLVGALSLQLYHTQPAPEAQLLMRSAADHQRSADNADDAAAMFEMEQVQEAKVAAERERRIMPQQAKRQAPASAPANPCYQGSVRAVLSARQQWLSHHGHHLSPSQRTLLQRYLHQQQQLLDSINSELSVTHRWQTEWWQQLDESSGAAPASLDALQHSAEALKQLPAIDWCGQP